MLADLVGLTETHETFEKIEWNGQIVCDRHMRERGDKRGGVLMWVLRDGNSYEKGGNAM